MHCSHLFKVLTSDNVHFLNSFNFQVSAKLQSCQESVSDPSDLVFSMKVSSSEYLNLISVENYHEFFN